MSTPEEKIDDCWSRIGVWRTVTDKCPELDKIIHCKYCPVFISTGRRFLNAAPPEGYRHELTRILSKDTQKETAKIRTAFVFRAGAEWLALPAQMIQEIVPMGPIHSIPNINSKVLRGLVNIHGRLQICVSIGRVLGIEKLQKNAAQFDSSFEAPERLVVVGQKNQTVAFPVSEVKGIIRYTPEMIKDLPVTVSGSKAVYTTGILHVDGKDIGLLKDKPLFKSLTKGLE